MTHAPFEVSSENFLSSGADIRWLGIDPQNPCVSALADCTPTSLCAEMRDRIFDLGIRAGAVTGIGLFDALHTDVVVFLDGARFEFARFMRDATGARPTLIVAARDIDGEIIDLVAVDLEKGLVATWLGVAAMLGEGQLSTPLSPDPIPVHATPLAWLRAGREGIVVISAKRAAPALVGRRLVVDDARFGARLRKALRLEPTFYVRTVAA